MMPHALRYAARGSLLPALCASLVLGCSASSGTDQNRASGGSGGRDARGNGGSPSGDSGGAPGSSTGGGTGTGGRGAGGRGAGGIAGAGAGPDGGGGAAGLGGGAGTGMGVGGRAAGGTSGTGGNRGGGGSGVGGTGTGGTGTGGTGTGGRAGQSGTFVLAWQDDFNALDLSAWQLQNFSFDGNLAQFSTQNASVANGMLTMRLTPDGPSAAKPYRGVEMRSARTLTYGKISARMRFAKGSGVVSGLVLFYTPFPNCNWNEIDIEHLGGSSNTSQLNCMVYTGSPVPGCSASVTPTQDPLVVNLGADAEADFHQYDVEWTPTGVSFFIEGRLLRTWTQRITLMTLPQTVLLTIWASSAADWAGPITPTSAPTSADVDWIRVYSLQN